MILMRINEGICPVEEDYLIVEGDRMYFALREPLRVPCDPDLSIMGFAVRLDIVRGQGERRMGLGDGIEIYLSSRGIVPARLEADDVEGIHTFVKRREIGENVGERVCNLLAPIYGQFEVKPVRGFRRGFEHVGERLACATGNSAYLSVFKEIQESGVL